MEVMISGDQRIKLTRIVNECMQQQLEIDTLKEGMKEVVKAIAAEMNIPAKLINKAIQLAHKNKTKEASDEQSLVESILIATGKGEGLE